MSQNRYESFVETELRMIAKGWALRNPVWEGSYIYAEQVVKGNPHKGISIFLKKNGEEPIILAQLTATLAETFLLMGLVWATKEGILDGQNAWERASTRVYAGKGGRYANDAR